MEFYAEKMVNEPTLFFIKIEANNIDHFTHNDIQYLLNIYGQEYVDLIDSFGAQKNWSGIVFDNYKLAEKFTNHLNDKYLVLLKLEGRI